MVRMSISADQTAKKISSGSCFFQREYPTTRNPPAARMIPTLSVSNALPHDQGSVSCMLTEKNEIPKSRSSTCCNVDRKAGTTWLSTNAPAASPAILIKKPARFFRKISARMQMTTVSAISARWMYTIPTEYWKKDIASVLNPNRTSRTVAAPNRTRFRMQR